MVIASFNRDVLENSRVYFQAIRRKILLCALFYVDENEENI